MRHDVHEFAERLYEFCLFLVTRLFRRAPRVEEIAAHEQQNGDADPEAGTSGSHEAEIGDGSGEVIPGSGEGGEEHPLHDRRFAVKTLTLGRLAGCHTGQVTAERQYAMDGLNDEQQQNEDKVDNSHWFRYPEYSLICE